MSQSAINYPRFRVTVNGSVLDGVSKVSVTQTNAFQIANFCFTKGFIANDAFPPSWWAATANKTILIAIQLSVDGNEFFPIITGNADSHTYDAIANTIDLVGRDLAAGMIDTRILTTYRNLTASEIAAQFAKEHSLDANITPTITIVGRIYDVDHDETSSGDFSQVTNEWDLLCRLGAAEGITPYVFGTTLYFNPPSNNPPVYPVELTRDSNGLLNAGVTGLILERHMTYARDVIVKVNSWNSRKRATITSTVRTKTKSESRDLTLKPSEYFYQIPNLNLAQCLAKAQQLALDISQHERNVRVSIPSLALMNPQTVITVSGTGTDYDIVYNPLTIYYEIRTEGGASTFVEAKFSSPLALYDDDTGRQLEDSQ